MKVVDGPVRVHFIWHQQLVSALRATKLFSMAMTICSLIGTVLTLPPFPLMVMAFSRSVKKMNAGDLLYIVSIDQPDDHWKKAAESVSTEAWRKQWCTKKSAVFHENLIVRLFLSFLFLFWHEGVLLLAWKWIHIKKQEKTAFCGENPPRPDTLWKFLLSVFPSCHIISSRIEFHFQI